MITVCSYTLHAGISILYIRIGDHDEELIDSDQYDYESEPLYGTQPRPNFPSRNHHHQNEGHDDWNKGYEDDWSKGDDNDVQEEGYGTGDDDEDDQSEWTPNDGANINASGDEIDEYSEQDNESQIDDTRASDYQHPNSQIQNTGVAQVSQVEEDDQVLYHHSGYSF